jgi:hypothetical protein
MAVDRRGEKLSKQSGAPAVHARDARAQLAMALAFLGQPPADTLAQAVAQWNPALIPAQRAREIAR